MKNRMPDWSWLGYRFITILPPLLILLYLIMWSYRVISGSGLVEQGGSLVGGDFPHYWVAASLARDGEAAAVYDVSRFIAAQEAVFGVKCHHVWLYPPTFLMLLVPLSLLPYLVSLTTWILITLVGYLLLLRIIAPHPLTIWLSLAFPGTFQNFAYGQNGFFSAILLGGGLLLLDNYPVAGGALLGLITYKPHLAVLIPLALIAGQRWRALIAMLISALVLILASLLALGNEVWSAFFNNMSISVQFLETGKVAESTILLLPKMPTVFAAVQLAGGSWPTAAICQGALMLLVAAAVAWVWFREASLPIRASLLVLGIFLFTPYAFVYDLAILALPLAWIGWQGYTEGWRWGERLGLLCSWLSPLFFIVLAQKIDFQIVPLILITFMFLVLRRVYEVPVRHCRERQRQQL